MSTNKKQEMTPELLARIFKYLGLVEVGTLFIFDTLEVYDTISEKSIYAKSLEELLAIEIKGRSIKDMLEEIEFHFYYSGGRGASSGGMGGGFQGLKGKARGRFGGGDEVTELFPATFNNQGRFATQEQTIKAFTKKYKNADKEYGISVDAQGFVHKHVRGGKTSVAISAQGKGHMIVHNHPNGSHFSDADLLLLAQDSHSSGIAAVGNKAMYIVQKKKNFAASSFAKAVKKAKWPAKYDYDTGANWWLKKNQDKFGYKYTKKAVR